jgi:hypothetical protein
VCGAARGTGTVRAVPVAVGGIAVVVDEVIATHVAAGEVLVRAQHTRVDDVHAHILAVTGGVERIVTGQVRLVNAVQAPQIGGVLQQVAAGNLCHLIRIQLHLQLADARGRCPAQFFPG